MIKHTLAELFKELEDIKNTLAVLQRTVESFDGDREILEDVVGRLTSLEEQSRLARKNDNSVSKDIKYEVQVAGDKVQAAVETQVESIKNMVENKRVKIKPKGFVSRLLRR